MAKRAKVKQLKTYIEGMDEVIDLLNDMGDEALDALDNASKAGGDIVLSDAIKRAPVDTGKLKASLVLKKSKVKNADVKSEYYVTKKRGVGYFVPVELGTSKIKAQPFLRPAVDDNKGRIAKKVNEEILKAIGRIK